MTLTALAGGTAVVRPRIPVPATIDALERALVDPAWRLEVPAPMRARAAEVSNHLLVRCIEEFGTGIVPGIVPLEVALAARELLVEFVGRAPRAIDDGAAARTWAAALIAVIAAVQCGSPGPSAVSIDRGLDDDVIDDEDDDDSPERVDFLQTPCPRWETLVAQRAHSLAARVGASPTEVADRAAVVRSTVAIGAKEPRWRVPSQRVVAAQVGRWGTP